MHLRFLSGSPISGFRTPISAFQVNPSGAFRTERDASVRDRLGALAGSGSSRIRDQHASGWVNCIAPGLMEALITREDGSHGSTEEVLGAVEGPGDPDGGRGASGSGVAGGGDLSDRETAGDSPEALRTGSARPRSMAGSAKVCPATTGRGSPRWNERTVNCDGRTRSCGKRARISHRRISTTAHSGDRRLHRRVP